MRNLSVADKMVDLSDLHPSPPTPPPPQSHPAEAKSSRRGQGRASRESIDAADGPGYVLEWDQTDAPFVVPFSSGTGLLRVVRPPSAAGGGTAFSPRQLMVLSGLRVDCVRALLSIGVDPAFIEAHAARRGQGWRGSVRGTTGPGWTSLEYPEILQFTGSAWREAASDGSASDTADLVGRPDVRAVPVAEQGDIAAAFCRGSLCCVDAHLYGEQTFRVTRDLGGA